MVYYNPQHWFGLIFKFHKSDTFRKLFWIMICVGIYAWFVAFLEIEIWHMRFKSITIVHSLLGFVISMLLVFRTNTAYDRWWEGRKLWGGLLNSSRNTAIKLNAYLDINDDKKRKEFASLITEYAFALKDHLRNKIGKNYQQNHDEAEPAHKPNLIASKLFEDVNTLYKNGTISGEQLIVINAELQSFTDICGACERIKKTPIPYSYSIFIKKFLFIYIMTMPFGFVSTFGYWVIIITIFILYVLVSLELIAEEIEDPFGNDHNDLPLGEISANIKRSVLEILRTGE